MDAPLNALSLNSQQDRGLSPGFHSQPPTDTPEHHENQRLPPITMTLCPFFAPAHNVLTKGEPLRAASIHAGFGTKQEFQTGFGGFFGGERRLQKSDF